MPGTTNNILSQEQALNTLNEESHRQKRQRPDSPTSVIVIDDFDDSQSTKKFLSSSFTSLHEAIKD